VFPVLLFMTDLGLVLSLVIAVVVALLDFVVLTWLMNRAVK